MTRPIGDRAVVLGASMAGLLAARVLADDLGVLHGTTPEHPRATLPPRCSAGGRWSRP
jgi:hypothetical protein